MITSFLTLFRGTKPSGKKVANKVPKLEITTGGIKWITKSDQFAARIYSRRSRENSRVHGKDGRSRRVSPIINLLHFERCRHDDALCDKECSHRCYSFTMTSTGSIAEARHAGYSAPIRLPPTAIAIDHNIHFRLNSNASSN